MIHKLAFALICAGALFLTVGCGDSKETMATKLGKMVGRTTRDFGKGVGKELLPLQSVDVIPSDSFLEAKLSVNPGEFKTTPSISSENNQGDILTVYVLSAAECKGHLDLRAYNEEDKEIGRSKHNIEFTSDDAQYLDFTFPKQMQRSRVKSFKIFYFKDLISEK